jgi:hypothetical protein
MWISESFLKVSSSLHSSTPIFSYLQVLPSWKVLMNLWITSPGSLAGLWSRQLSPRNPLVLALTSTMNQSLPRPLLLLHQLLLHLSPPWYLLSLAHPLTYPLLSLEEAPATMAPDAPKSMSLTTIGNLIWLSTLPSVFHGYNSAYMVPMMASRTSSRKLRYIWPMTV